MPEEIKIGWRYTAPARIPPVKCAGCGRDKNPLSVYTVAGVKGRLCRGCIVDRDAKAAAS